MALFRLNLFFFFFFYCIFLPLDFEAPTRPTLPLRLSSDTTWTLVPFARTSLRFSFHFYIHGLLGGVTRYYRKHYWLTLENGNHQQERVSACEDHVAGPSVPSPATFVLLQRFEPTRHRHFLGGLGIMQGAHHFLFGICFSRLFSEGAS